MRITIERRTVMGSTSVVTTYSQCRVLLRGSISATLTRRRLEPSHLVWMRFCGSPKCSPSHGSL